MTRNTKRTMAVVMSLALAASGLVQAQGTSAATKVKLSSSKATIKVGAKKAVTIKGVKKSNVKKLTLKSSSKAATVKKNSNVKFTVTGKKAGKATITAKVALKKAVAKKKAYTLKFAATIKSASVVNEKTVTALADLEATLKSVNAKGGTVTLLTDESGSLEIAKADYSNVDLIVSAPLCDIVNNAKFKSVTIQAIKANTWTENGVGNDIEVTSDAATRLIVGADGILSSLVYSNNATAPSTLEVLGEVKNVEVNGTGVVNATAAGTGKIGDFTVSGASDVTLTAGDNSTISKVDVKDANAKLNVTAGLSATVSNITVEAAAEVTITGNSTNPTTVQAVSDAKVTNSAPNVTVETISPAGSASPVPTATAAATTTPAATTAPTASTNPGGSSGGGAGAVSGGDGTPVGQFEIKYVDRYDEATFIVELGREVPNMRSSDFTVSAGGTSIGVSGISPVSSSNYAEWLVTIASPIQVGVDYTITAYDGTTSATKDYTQTYIMATTIDQFKSALATVNGSSTIDEVVVDGDIVITESLSLASGNTVYINRGKTLTIGTSGSFDVASSSAVVNWGTIKTDATGIKNVYGYGDVVNTTYNIKSGTVAKETANDTGAALQSAVRAAGFSSCTISTSYTNDYSIGVLWTAIGGATSKTLYKTVEYFDSNNDLLAVDSSTYTSIANDPKVGWASWGANIQNGSWEMVELKDAVAGVSTDVAYAQVTITSALPSYGEACAAESGTWKITDPTSLKKSVDFGSAPVLYKATIARD